MRDLEYYERFGIVNMRVLEAALPLFTNYERFGVDFSKKLPTFNSNFLIFTNSFHFAHIC